MARACDLILILLGWVLSNEPLDHAGVQEDIWGLSKEQFDRRGPVVGCEVSAAVYQQPCRHGSRSTDAHRYSGKYVFKEGMFSVSADYLEVHWKGSARNTWGDKGDHRPQHPGIPCSAVSFSIVGFLFHSLPLPAPKASQGSLRKYAMDGAFIWHFTNRSGNSLLQVFVAHVQTDEKVPVLAIAFRGTEMDANDDGSQSRLSDWATNLDYTLTSITFWDRTEEIHLEKTIRVCWALRWNLLLHVQYCTVVCCCMKTLVWFSSIDCSTESLLAALLMCKMCDQHLQ